MKRFLVIVGGLTLAVIAAGAVGIALYAPEGRRLDASSRDYAAHVLDTTMKNWDPSALRAESSDELLAAVPDEKLAQLLQTFSARAGTDQVTWCAARGVSAQPGSVPPGRDGGVCRPNHVREGGRSSRVAIHLEG